MNKEELVNKIKEASQAYYENGKAIMTDADFDKLVEDLRSVDPDNEILHKPGFGYDTSKVGRREVYHEGKLYTIDLKIKDFDEFKRYCKSIKDQGFTQYIQPKFDGISGTVYYKDGKITKVVTRGDGIKGFDIKNNINLESLEGLIENGSVRIEVCISWEDWKKNYDIEENPSPRNLVAGICSKLQVEDWERKIAKPIILDVTENEIGTKLFMGFEQEFGRLLSIDEVDDKLPKEDFPTDGYVIKYWDSDDNMNVYAFKPSNEMAETVIEDIIWQEGNTGKLTPVLQIKPIKLSGATISRVTGNSMAMMENLGTGIGAKVKVFRSGEVIPCIGEVLERSENFNLPQFDYRKGAHIFREININISKKVVYMMTNLKHFGWSLTEKIMEMEGVDNLYDLGIFIENVDNMTSSDYYTAHEIKLMKDALNLIRGYSYQQFVVGLNLPNIGWSAVNKIVKKEKLPIPAEKTWSKVESIVHKVKDSLQLGFGFDLRISVEKKVESIGKVVITGKHEMKRSEMEEKLREMGYEIQGAVNKDTDYLIIADINSNSSKAKKARSLNVRLVSFEELMQYEK